MQDSSEEKNMFVSSIPTDTYSWVPALKLLEQSAKMNKKKHMYF